MRRQVQALISHLNNINTKQQVQIIEPPVNFMFNPSEGKVNPGDPQEIKLYVQYKQRR